MANYSQGSFFRKNKLLTTVPNCLQIILYHDDFGVSNPLGNKLKKYKMSAFYFVLGNIPGKYRSWLKDVQLTLLFPSELTQKYGYHVLIEPLLDDIKVLESTGLYVKFEGKYHIFRGTVAMLVADSLAAHTLGGFYCNFSTVQWFFRFCNASKQGLIDDSNRKDWVLRTREGYDLNIRHLLDDPSMTSVYGLKSNSCLNELQFFHIVVEGLSPDLAHDVFEGFSDGLISNILESLMTQKKFSL